MMEFNAEFEIICPHCNQNITIDEYLVSLNQIENEVECDNCDSLVIYDLDIKVSAKNTREEN